MDGIADLLHNSSQTRSWSERMEAAASRHIPHYFLYGGEEPDGELDLLHVEAIRNRSGQNNWSIRPHAHPDHMQVLLVTQGGGEIVMEDRRFPIPAQALVVVPSGIVHQIEFDPDTDGTVTTVALGCIEKIVAQAPNLAETLQPAVFPLTELADLSADFRRLKAEFDGAAQGRRAALVAHLTCILVAVQRLSITREDARIAASDRNYDLVTRYRELLEAHFRHEKRLDFYAGALAITPARLNAACKARAGCTASQLMHGRILVEAKRQLLYTNSSVAVVASLTGFDDPAYFNRFFTQRVGVSPGAYRKSVERPGAAERPTAPVGP
ncbi:helix-turn-helix domain-containing protein [Oceanicola sp. 502str15]|uniref:helix-turn-helix domain-containing protein n=1 Tax=Oceanicola sp. 502str15 TaxID=2696061 RepID=UPI00209595E5|nr:helix-turn-helix domain-containing protein [Oceanicola sp. 502str15]